MSCEFIFPFLGGLAGWGLMKGILPRMDQKEQLVTVLDEIPITEIKDDLGTTQTGQFFKVLQFVGQSVAGKKSDELEKAFINRSLFFRNISEYRVQLRLISQKQLYPVVKKEPCHNSFLDELVERWENKLDKSFKTTHYTMISSQSEGEIDSVIKEAFTSLAELEPKVLRDDEITTFLTTLYNFKEFKVGNNLDEIAQSRIEIDTKGVVSEQYAGQEKYRLVFGIKDIGETVNQKIMDGLLAIPYAMTVSVHIQTVNKTATLSNLDKRILQLNLGKKEINLSSNQQIKELRDEVENNHCSLLQSEFTILVTIDDKDQIEKVSMDVYGVLGKYGVRPVLEERLSMPKFWGQCPGRDAFNRELLLTSKNLADFAQ